MISLKVFSYYRWNCNKRKFDCTSPAFSKCRTRRAECREDHTCAFEMKVQTPTTNLCTWLRAVFFGGHLSTLSWRHGALQLLVGRSMMQSACRNDGMDAHAACPGISSGTQETTAEDR